MNVEWYKKYIEMSLKVIEKEVDFIRRYLKELKEIEQCNPCDTEPLEPCLSPLDKRPQDCPFQKEREQ